MQRIVLTVVLALAIAGCQKKSSFDAAHYISYQPGNEYTFSGDMTIVVDSLRRANNGTEIFVHDVDASGNVLTRETYLKKDGGLFWREFDGAAAGLPRYVFDPPLPASPFSDQVGAKLSVSGTEVFPDSPESTLRYRLDSEIEAIENISVAAGDFPDCIRMRGTFAFLDSIEASPAQGEARWWYARGVGVVKYSIPGSEGELVRAKIGDRLLP